VVALGAPVAVVVVAADVRCELGEEAACEE
jgi:hypothetical protein